jgi:hypothetical protein
VCHCASASKDRRQNLFRTPYSHSAGDRISSVLHSQCVCARAYFCIKNAVSHADLQRQRPIRMACLVPSFPSSSQGWSQASRAAATWARVTQELFSSARTTLSFVRGLEFANIWRIVAITALEEPRRQCQGSVIVEAFVIYFSF